MSQPVGVHLVGSIPFKTEEEVFTKVNKLLPRRLVTIPDGETGIRESFIYWQKERFPKEIQGPLFRESEPPADQYFKCSLEDIKPTQYDTAAVSSYQKFCQLRKEGVIPSGVRFQVGLPGILSVIYLLVDAKYMDDVVPLYEQRYIEDIKRLQEQIPAHDLAIQFDLSAEVAIMEQTRGRLNYPLFDPYWAHDGDVLQGVTNGIVRLARLIRPEASLGFHLCYGDLGNKHWIEPQDTSLLTEMANGLVKALKPNRPVNWFHMPCPKDRTDVAYYEPLKQLSIDASTKLFLGLVHPFDKEGTLKRIAAAQEVYRGSFGVATECGMGRMPPEGKDDKVDSIFEILAAVSAPAL